MVTVTFELGTIDFYLIIRIDNFNSFSIISIKTLRGGFNYLSQVGEEEWKTGVTAGLTHRFEILLVEKAGVRNIIFHRLLPGPRNLLISWFTAHNHCRKTSNILAINKDIAMTGFENISFCRIFFSPLGASSGL